MDPTDVPDYMAVDLEEANAEAARSAAAHGIDDRNGYVIKVLPGRTGKIIEVVSGGTTISFEIAEENISTFCDFLNDR